MEETYEDGKRTLKATFGEGPVTLTELIREKLRGSIANVMVLYPPSTAEFAVAIGNTYDGQDFYQDGNLLVSPLAAA